MYKKLSNQEWEEQIEEYYNKQTSITISKFCEDNNLSKQQFHYHKKKRLETLSTNNTVFQAIPVISKERPTKSVTNVEKIKISIGTATITVLASETAVISLVVENQPSQC